MGDLIFDIGLHEGQDTDYFLSRGHRVIGIDANPAMIQRATNRYSDYIDSGYFQALFGAVGASTGTASFYLSPESTWCSLYPEVAGRNGLSCEAITVPQYSLSSLIDRYGVPYYCKIDIEGADHLALESLQEAVTKPTYISVESECIGSEIQLSGESALQTINRLCQLGYNQFKLVDQVSLMPLGEEPFYNENKINKVRRFLRKKLGLDYRSQLRRKWGYTFIAEASGPFGEDIEGKWYDYHDACRLLLKHRADYFQKGYGISYGFWCDWHAKMV